MGLKYVKSLLGRNWWGKCWKSVMEMAKHSESGVQVLFFWELRQSGAGQERWRSRNGGQQEVKGRAVARAGGRRVWPEADKASSPLSICSRVRVWPAEEGGHGWRVRRPVGPMVSALLAGTHMEQDYKVNKEGRVRGASSSHKHIWSWENYHSFKKFFAQVE